MQSSFNDKLAYSYPCKTSEACIDNDDYDLCESNDDITEKDLAVLLKEEAAKLEKEKQKEKALNDKKAEPSSDADDKPKETNDGGFKEEDEGVAIKKSCKYIKNPFFTNRLKLSTSHLPLPPPGPPPQNFPLAVEESTTIICPKKKKKCRKDDKNKMALYEEGRICEYYRGVTEEDGEENLDEEQKEQQYEPKDSGAKKKHCKKTGDKLPPCKKKESEVSGTFQPRKIPLQQKDLPQTSPTDIPEVEHQILMACRKNGEEDCKKKCKKKDKVK